MAAAVTKNRSQRPRVVILGAGFAALTAARHLAGAYLDIVLVDRQNYHLFQPLLYQVATAGLSPVQIPTPIRGVLRKQASARVRLAKVTGIGAAARQFETTEGHIGYDRLVVATGARHAYFGHDKWEPFAPGLKRIDDATALRRRIRCDRRGGEEGTGLGLPGHRPAQAPDRPDRGWRAAVGGLSASALRCRQSLPRAPGVELRTGSMVTGGRCHDMSANMTDMIEATARSWI
jgi:NADPH-dependent 2,4-dienoyl-CoA reductase/sulfur reductase-like enzyme